MLSNFEIAILLLLTVNLILTLYTNRSAENYREKPTTPPPKTPSSQTSAPKPTSMRVSA
jgi:hypothetical protein